MRRRFCTGERDTANEATVLVIKTSWGYAHTWANQPQTLNASPVISAAQVWNSGHILCYHLKGCRPKGVSRVSNVSRAHKKNSINYSNNSRDNKYRTNRANKSSKRVTFYASSFLAAVARSLNQGGINLFSV